MLRWLAGVVSALVALAGCAKAPDPGPDPGKDRASIEAALQQWPNDFNAENLPAVCGLFADDVVLAYPGSPERGYQQFCDQMRQLFDSPSHKYSYDAPDVQEVVVDGDLAAVRLIWKLTVRDTSGAVLETTEENGVDVFRRQPDGSWKIHISHAFSVV